VAINGPLGVIASAADYKTKLRARLHKNARTALNDVQKLQTAGRPISSTQINNDIVCCKY